MTFPPTIKDMKTKTNIKLLSIKRLAVCVFLLIAGSYHNYAQTNLQDSLALVKLYTSTNGTGWTNNAGWLQDDVINWNGVTVNNGRVTELKLNHNLLAGNLPPELGNLNNLTDLNLSYNQLNGSIPSELGNLNNLRVLYLENNQLSGIIPTEFGNLVILQQIRLNDNQLSGSIPNELGNLSNLTDLRLHVNQLTGNIPVEIGNLTSLSMYLLLRNNQLSGSIPPEIGNLVNLKYLDIRSNLLSGSIPLELANMVNLRSLVLADNELNGPILSEFGNLSYLTELWLQDNLLTGSIPPELGNLINLTQLYLNNNQLTGEIPVEIGNLNKLLQLKLENNQLSGAIPPEIGNLILQYLRLNDNLFTELPDLSSLSDLRELAIQNNILDFGDIEPNIGVPAWTFIYSPQDSIGEKQNFVLFVGDLQTISVEVGGQNNQYQWYKNGIPISGANDTEYIINSASIADKGEYICKITNTLATNLTLYSHPKFIEITTYLQSDSLALVTFFNATGGPNWANNSGWLQAPVSEWFGVTVENERVTRLDLYINEDENNNLNGVIPNDIGDLSNLTYLNLGGGARAYNNLTGEIPVDIGKLTQLTVLHLGWNNLTGNIPSEFGNLINLKWLALGGNQLFGNVPIELGNLHNLEFIALHDNQFDGTIPDELATLTKLYHFNIGNNKITGKIPTFLSNYTNLREIWLNGNQLSGNIPPELGNIIDLEILRLNNNQITGSIPANLGNLSNLTTLYLHYNQLTGPIPPEIGNLSSLKYLYLTYNQLNAPLPSEIGNLSNLEVLYMYGSQLNGPIPVELENLTNLTFLNLGNNQLNGGIPAEIGNLTNLYYMNLGGNPLGGEIPAELGNLINMDQLLLYENQLSGEIPSEFGNLVKLKYFSLNNNNLTGNIPSEFGNLSDLIKLRLDQNNLTGEIPAELNNLTNLTHLHLNYNQFTTMTDLSSLAILNTLEVQENELYFDDIELNMGVAPIYNYSPQRFGEGLDIIGEIGSDYQFDATIGPDPNNYLWHFNGGEIPVATQAVYSIEDLQADEMGRYECYVTNPSVPHLVLISLPFFITNGCYPPFNLTGRSETLDDILLSWSAPELREPFQYRIYRNEELFIEVDGNQTTYTDLQIEKAREYNYYLTAYYNEEPVGESTPSNKIKLCSKNKYDYLSINNIDALLNSDGNCFGLSDGSIGFEYPANSGKHLIYKGNIWIGGESDGNLYLAANRFSHFPDSRAFSPGPIADYYDQEYFNKWEQVWKVNKEDIEYFRQHYLDEDYSIHYSIKNWPAHGDETIGMAPLLAPFIDTDNNGIYEPSEGDYPDIKGDQAIYFIFNDVINAPNLTGNELNFEYHCMAYGYNEPNDSILFNTIFLHYKIFNRSNRSFSEMKLGYFSDIDIGNAGDDYMGCDTILNTYFGYNDIDDEIYGYRPPAVGAVFLTDKMQSFIAYNNASGERGEPSIAGDYWNYLNARWKDGAPLIYGGNGYPYVPPNETTNFIFPGDLNNPEEWSDISAGNPANDKRGIGVISFPLPAGESYEFDIGFVAALDYNGNNITSVNLLKERITELQNIYDLNLGEWNVDPTKYEFDGEIVAEVLIDDIAVTEGGILAAFVGEECRGVTKGGMIGPAGKYVFVLRCYSNNVSGEALDFKFYDHNLIQVLDINEEITFEPNMIIANALDPFQMNAYTTIDISIPLSQGWTWFSLNGYNQNMNIDEVLSSLALSENDYIKSQRFSSTYYEGYNWFGNLEEFNNRDMYKILLNQSDLLEYTGYPVEPDEVPIEINAGWTWVAYTPQYNLQLSDALTTLNLQDLDYIKNQRFSSTYYEGYGWFGTLEELFPNDGYMIKSAEPGTLVYPPQIESAPQILIEKINKSYISFFDFNPSLYRFNGSLTAEVLIDENNSGSTENILFAFTGNKCRGQTKGLIFPPTGEYIYNLMIYSNIESGEEITFRFYNSKEDQWYEFEEKLNFESDMIESNAYDPFELKNGSAMNTNWMTDNEFSFDVYPNPFNEIFNINFNNQENQRIIISIYDLYGRKIGVIEDKFYQPGNHILEWDSNNMPNSVYYIWVQTDGFVRNKKVVKVK